MNNEVASLMKNEEYNRGEKRAMIEVSAGVIHDAVGRILICQRGEGRSNAHLWEFPGGKREAGETAAQCLVRELMEELSLPVTDVQEIAHAAHDGIDFTFLAAQTDRLPVLTEHEDARFVQPRELLRYDFCPADLPVARMMSFHSVCHAFWDFDGTLLDSYPAMVRAFVAGAKEFGVTVAPERALSLMKNNLWYCCVTISGECGVSAEALCQAFRRHERAELAQGLPPMAHIPETLEALSRQGVKHYVATHRDLVCRELLQKAGLLQYFSGFVTEEDRLPRKPAPDMLLCLMQRHGLDPAQCMMVGDRPLDTEAGMAADVLSVLIDPENRFPDSRCDLRIADPLALAQWIP